jgi:Na+/H+-dicarboxylate symporter
VALTVLSSIGTPGIPGGSFVIMTMVLTSVGIPAEGLALILGLDRPLDMLRTAVNVTGDAMTAVIVDKK